MTGYSIPKPASMEIWVVVSKSGTETQLLASSREDALSVATSRGIDCADAKQKTATTDQAEASVVAQDTTTTVNSLAGYKVVDTQEQPDSIQVTVTLISDAKECPYCQSKHIQRFGSKRQGFKDIPTKGKRTEILIDRQRYRCKECHRTFSEVLSHMADRRSMTTRLVDYIQTLSRTHRSHVRIAAEVGISERTVRNVLRDDWTCKHIGSC